MSFYQGNHRKALSDNSDIEELERQRQAQLNPSTEDEVSAEVEEIAPNAEDLPPPQNVEEETFKKRYSDLRRHMANKEKEWQGKFSALEAKLAELSNTKLDLPSSTDTDEVAQWMKQYPDVARIVSKIAEAQADSKTAEVRKQVESLEQERARLAREKAEIKLREKHADIDALKNSEEFHEWVAAQPKLIQDALYHNATDWQAAARAIDLYKSDKEKLEAPKRGRPKKEDIEASAPVTVKNRAEPSNASAKRVFKESEIAKMQWRQYDELEPEIMLARQEGRIIYDLSQKMASM